MGESIQALSKGLKVLAVLGQSPAPLRNIEIVRALKDDGEYTFSPNGVLRVLESLQHDGFVSKGKGDRWMTTAKTMRLARQFADRF